MRFPMPNQKLLAENPQNLYAIHADFTDGTDKNGTHEVDLNAAALMFIFLFFQNPEAKSAGDITRVTRVWPRRILWLPHTAQEVHLEPKWLRTIFNDGRPLIRTNFKNHLMISSPPF